MSDIVSICDNVEGPLISVSDVLKLLDQLPVWKTIKLLPQRVDALEKENAVLKQRLDELLAEPNQAAGEVCKACGEPAVRRISSKPSSVSFGRLGARDEVWKCEACGDTETRLVIT